MSLHIKYLAIFILYTVMASSRQYMDAGYRFEPEETITKLVSYKAKAVIFLSPACPLCQGYSLTLRKLYESYHSKGIEFEGVVSGSSFSAGEIKEYKKKFKIPFQIVSDPGMLLAQTYHATITPEVIILDPGNKVLYSGRIDNWAYALGRRRQSVTENNLKDALEDILNNREIKTPKTTAIGCFIE